MDLRRLRLFVAVAEHGGFTAAAAAEHVAQPAVSLAVRELEQEVGAPLFTRSRAGAALTAAGEALLGPARQTLRDLEHAAAAVAAVTGLVAGHLDLACLPTLAADPVAGLVGRFRREHPGVTVRMGAPLDLEELADAVRSGAAEVGITERGAANTDLEEVTIGEQELFAVGPARPRGRRPSGPLRLDRLGTVPLVLSPTGSSLRDAVDLALAAVEVRPEIGVETAQRDALIPLVLAGAGPTFLPDTLARAAGRLGATVRPTRPRLRRTIALVHRPGDPGPAAARFLRLAAP
jgi:LysR family transcriptional regulator, carnitine catabolism transcriptional activator